MEIFADWRLWGLKRIRNRHFHKVYDNRPHRSISFHRDSLTEWFTHNIWHQYPQKMFKCWGHFYMIMKIMEDASQFSFFLPGLSVGSLHLLGHPHSVSDHIFLIQVSSVHKVITVALFFWHSLERNHTSITHWNWHQRETISWQIPFPWFMLRTTIAYNIKMKGGGSVSPSLRWSLRNFQYQNPPKVKKLSTEIKS